MPMVQRISDRLADTECACVLSVQSMVHEIVRERRDRRLDRAEATMSGGSGRPATVLSTPVTVHHISGTVLPGERQAGGLQIGSSSSSTAAAGLRTPLATEGVISKLYIKAVSSKTFVLRDVCLEAVASISELKNLIKDDIVDGDFDNARNECYQYSYPRRVVAGSKGGCKGHALV